MYTSGEILKAEIYASDKGTRLIKRERVCVRELYDRMVKMFSRIEWQQFDQELTAKQMARAIFRQKTDDGIDHRIWLEELDNWVREMEVTYGIDSFNALYWDLKREGGLGRQAWNRVKSEKQLVAAKKFLENELNDLKWDNLKHRASSPLDGSLPTLG